MKYFVFAITLIFSATASLANDFFIPKGAMMVAKDRLQPLSNAQREHTGAYSQGRYTILDGRVIALENEVRQEPAEVAIVETVTQDEPEITEQEPKVSVVQKSTVTPPITPEIDYKKPIYKNRYALYVNDLKVFAQTKKMPENQDLSILLKRFESPRSVTVFDSVIE